MNNSKPSSTEPNKPGYRVGIIILAIIVIWMASQMWQGSLLPEGSIAPTWRLPIADGSSKLLELEELRGKVVILDFWSTTCPPCLRQMKELDVVLQKMKPRGVEVVGVATGGETISEIEMFAKQRNVNYPLLVDSGNISNSYNVVSLPTLYVIDREGRIAAAHRGFWPRNALSSAVSRALSQ